MGQVAITDEKLLAASRQGGVDAFGTLVERYESLVWSVCFSTTQSRALSDDITQETFLAAWSGLGGLRDAERWRAWVCGIARNLSRKAIRRRPRERPLEEAGEVASPGTPLDDVIDREQSRLVWGALERIPERYRTPLVLFYQEGLGAKEIGAALALSEAAVHQRLSRGRRYLRDDLAKLVEGTLSQNRPGKRGIAAAVTAAIVAGAVPSADAAARATGDSTMMTMKVIGATALVAALGAGYWVNNTKATPPKEPTAAVAPTNDDPVVTEQVAMSNTPDDTTRELPTERVVAPARNRFGRFGVKGVKKDWAEGRLAALLGRCFEEHPHLGRQYTFTLRYENDRLAIGGGARRTAFPASDVRRDRRSRASYRLEGIRASGGDGIGPNSGAIEKCLQEKLAEFDLTPEANETPTLSVSFGTKKEKPAFDAEAIEAMDLDIAPFRGDRDAEVTMIVFVGFRCFFCGKLLGTIDQLLEEYAGHLRVVVKPLALRATDTRVTEAAYAALAQDRFWPMHDAMLADQDGLVDDDLESFAKRAGLDLDRFAADMKTGTFREQVEVERTELRGMGIVAVPTVVLNGERIMGARPIEQFRTRIDAALAKTSR